MVMIAIEMDIQDGKGFEQIAEFLRCEIVMRQARLDPIKWNVRSWLNLLELCSLVLQLGHSHKKQATSFEDTSHLIDQSSNLSQLGMMDYLDRYDRIEKSIIKWQSIKDIVLHEVSRQTSFFQAVLS